MSYSIPISSLNELIYITADDYMPIVDSGSMTTFKTSVNTFKNYFALSGSVLSASWASASISASYALNADTASYLYPRLYEMTASWALNILWSSVVGTASLAYNARTASRLEGIGDSYERTLVINESLTTTGSGYIQIPRRTLATSTVGSMISLKSGSLFLNKDYQRSFGTNGYGKLYFLDNGTFAGKLVFEVGDAYVPVDSFGPNIDAVSKVGKGFLFQSNEAGNLNNLQRTGSLLFISSSGVTYGRTFEGYIFSSSIATTGPVSFYGTASYAISSSYSRTSGVNVPVGTIVGYAGTVAPTGWLICDGNLYDPLIYVDLADLIGTNYGRGLTISKASTVEHSSTYHDANDGTATITWVSGGSGNFSLKWGVTTYYINGTTANFKKFTGLGGGYYSGQAVNYSFVWTDLGTVTAYTESIAVYYITPPVPTTNIALSATSYRIPNMTNYFLTYTTLNPFIWIIKY
jgi:hypothetical protein